MGRQGNQGKPHLRGKDFVSFITFGVKVMKCNPRPM
jgi:hypothetical protein